MLDPLSRSLPPILSLQVRHLFTSGVPTPAVGTTEQRRIIESQISSVSPAIRFPLNALAQWCKQNCCRGSAAANMVDECWDAGHGGHNEADHEFCDAVAGDLVSAGGVRAQKNVG